MLSTASTSGRPQAYSHQSSSTREPYCGHAEAACHGVGGGLSRKRPPSGCCRKDKHGFGGRKSEVFRIGTFDPIREGRCAQIVPRSSQSAQKSLQGDEYFQVRCSQLASERRPEVPSEPLTENIVLTFSSERAANCLAVLLIGLNLILPPQSLGLPLPETELADEIRSATSLETHPSGYSESFSYYEAVSLRHCGSTDCSVLVSKSESESSQLRSGGSGLFEYAADVSRSWEPPASSLAVQADVYTEEAEGFEEAQKQVRNLVEKSLPDLNPGVSAASPAVNPEFTPAFPTPNPKATAASKPEFIPASQTLNPEVSADLSWGPGKAATSQEPPASSSETGAKGAVEAQKEVKTLVEKSLPAATPDLDPEVNADLVLEAWNVVDQVYLDARGKGFDREAWAAKREDALKHPIRSRIAAYSTIRSFMSSLHDPFTRFLTPEQFQGLSKFDISGIGLNMGEIDDDNGMTSLRVLGVVHDSVAHAAGIRQGDELLRVGGTSVKGKSAFEATSLLQGPVGQQVTLELQKVTGEVFKVTVPRGKEAQQPVTYKLERDSERNLVGYVKLRDFSALAKKGVVEAVQKMKEAGAQSFILDLQDNLGGLVQAGIEIARLFLDEGETVVYTEGRTPDTQKTVRAQAPATFSAPLLVLVNENTASASEIVAGALHDNCRALLVGSKTYGKGLIQSVYELSDGSALAITVGKYITPGHIDIDKEGIVPDFTRSPGPFNWFVPLPSTKEIESKLQMCVPPEIPPEVERRKGLLAAAVSGIVTGFRLIMMGQPSRQ